MNVPRSAPPHDLAASERRLDSTAEKSATIDAHASEPSGRYLYLLALTALGVVYGDIGTSPLYAMRECFHGPHAVAPTPENVVGVLSLIFWSLVVVISIKYLVFVMLADNRGEGGILALTALVSPLKASGKLERYGLVMLGLFGAALLYGDGMITPAISVLSAVEGLEVATPVFGPYILPITIAILVALFYVQSRGTAGVGAVFGPITLVWFTLLAILGIAQIVRVPGVVAAINPLHAIAFFGDNGFAGFRVLGSVFLVVTGGEALYADMGHFGLRPIRLAWFTLVLPALLLNYFGQGALLIANPEAAASPFYRMGPGWALYPMVGIATLATVIASQAVISGAFSLTLQAVQLGFLPRLLVQHTSAREMGQIYVPSINWALLVACIGLVVGFQTSSNLAAAYGVAVTSTMAITTVLFFVILRTRWRWSLPASLALCGLFLVVDLAFFGANALKILDGGWFPLALALVIFVVMTTWKTGRRLLGERLRARTRSLREFLEEIASRPPIRIPGTAIFMYSNPNGTPPALVHNLEHNHVLHENVVVLIVETEEVSHLNGEERYTVERLGNGFFRIALKYGFMEEPDIPEALSRIDVAGLDLTPARTSYFLGQETLIATPERGMALWRERLFIFMSRNSATATRYFNIPAERVVELGSQVEL
jgi:KUP system potassium uptake protein